MKVVLAGNPNAGKTTLFNSLTASNLRTGNFHGVTTCAARKVYKGTEFVDVPGAYSFSAYTMEEEEAKKEVETADVIINVIDCLTLENSLSYTRELLRQNKKVVIYLTKIRQLKARGGHVDAQKLSQVLGVPVLICTPAKLKKILLGGEDFPAAKKKDLPLSCAYSPPERGLTPLDKLFYNRFFSLFFFAAAMVLTFFVAFHPAMPGALLKDLTESFIVDKLGALAASKIQNPAISSLIAEGVLGGAGTVLSFIPQLCVLYLILALLDESGITSALAFCTDGLFEKVNLSGRAAFSLISGFGCTAAAVLTTRGYSTPSAQKRTVAILPFVPCGAKLPVFLTFLSPLFENPFPVVACLYFIGVAAALIAARLSGGGKEEMLAEVTPVGIPSFKSVVLKLCFQIKGFIIKVAGPVLAFCIASWFLSHFGFTFKFVGTEQSMLAYLSRGVLPIFAPVGVTDWRLAYAALCGFIAKENVAATIAMLMPAGTGLDLSASLAMCAFILFCPACVSAFAACVRETGLKFTCKCYFVQLLIALTAAYTVRLIFTFI